MKKVTNKKVIGSKVVLAAFALGMSIIAVGCDGAHFDEDTGQLVEVSEDAAMGDGPHFDEDTGRVVEASEDVAMEAPENYLRAFTYESCVAWTCHTMHALEFIPDTQCGANEYEYRAVGLWHDRICKPLTECSDGEYEKTAPTATSDRVCAAFQDANECYARGFCGFNGYARGHRYEYDMWHVGAGVRFESVDLAKVPQHLGRIEVCSEPNAECFAEGDRRCLAAFKQGVQNARNLQYHSDYSRDEHRSTPRYEWVYGGQSFGVHCDDWTGECAEVDEVCGG